MTWRAMSDEEVEAMRPYTLDCSALSKTARDKVRDDFRSDFTWALTLIARHFGRPPTQDEADKLHIALVKDFNEERIPLIPPEIIH